MKDHTPRELITKFYSDSNLGPDGGVSKTSVRVEINSWLHFYFPNIKARRKTVLKHDLHHLLTGYSTVLSGETEISAWEIASGCKTYWVAFILDTSGVMLGFPFYFWRMLKAFARGRRTKNLYSELFTNEQALDMSISDLRHRLLLDKYPIDTKPSWIDFILFSLFVVYGLLVSALSLVFLPFIIVYSLYIASGKRKGEKSVKATI